MPAPPLYSRQPLPETERDRSRGGRERAYGRRWQSREVAPRGPQRAKLEDLRELRHLLQAVFETKQEADRWLHAPMPAFRGRVWRHVPVGAEPLHLGLTSEAAIAEFEKHLATYPAPPGWGAVRQRRG